MTSSTTSASRSRRPRWARGAGAHAVRADDAAGEAGTQTGMAYRLRLQGLPRSARAAGDLPSASTSGTPAKLTAEQRKLLDS